VLGVDFTTTKCMGLHITADLRVKEALVRARRIKSLAFLSYNTMVTTITSLVMAKASWGWWRCKPAKSTVTTMDSAIRRTLGLANRTSCMVLHRLLRGHQLDLDFVAGTSAMAYLMAAAKTRAEEPVARRPTRRITATTGWTTRVNRWHEDMGGTRAGAAYKLGDTTTWTSTIWKGQRGKALHQYREYWRLDLWNTYNDSTVEHRKRIGPYNEKYCAEVRKSFADATTAQRKIMSGSVPSIATMGRWTQPAVIHDVCPLCGAPGEPHWLHMAWSCSALGSSRPPTPGGHYEDGHDDAQPFAVARARRYGWPLLVNKEQDTHVLRHLEEVRLAGFTFSGYA
jgi:hypothetical protein